MTDDQLALARYRVSDLLEDLIGAEGNDEAAAIATALWREAAELLLTGERCWSGTGKGLLREVVSYDADRGTGYATKLMAGLRAATAGDAGPLAEVLDEILTPYGGRLFAGFRLGGEPTG